MHIFKLLFYKCSNFSLFHILDTPKNKEDNSVSCLNHFREDFVKPYGLAHDAVTYDDATLPRRLNTYNSKFYLRSQCGISEFSETLLENIAYLENNAEILDMVSLNAFIKKTRRFEPYLKILNSKKEDTGMFHHIKILNIMFTFSVCTSYKC